MCEVDASEESPQKNFFCSLEKRGLENGQKVRRLSKLMFREGENSETWALHTEVISAKPVPTCEGVEASCLLPDSMTLMLRLAGRFENITTMHSLRPDESKLEILTT